MAEHEHDSKNGTKRVHDSRRKHSAKPGGGEGKSSSNAGGGRVSPLDDVMFQKIFGSADSGAVLGPLVNAALEAAGLAPVESIDQIKADARIPHAAGLKSPRCDVVLVSGDRAVIVEAQLYEANYENKATYYASSSLAERVGTGGDSRYRDVPQTVVLFLLQGRTMFPASDRAVTIGRLHWELDGSCLPGNDGRLNF